MRFSVENIKPEIGFSLHYIKEFLKLIILFFFMTKCYTLFNFLKNYSLILWGKVSLEFYKYINDSKLSMIL